jgi:hypothetical protein
MRGVGIKVTAAMARSVARSCRVGTRRCATPSIRGAGVRQFRRGHSPRERSAVSGSLGWHGDREGFVGSGIAGRMTRHVGSHVGKQ